MTSTRLCNGKLKSFVSSFPYPGLRLSSALSTMSTNPHYQGPASLPSDYALLSRYVGCYSDGDRTEQQNVSDEGEFQTSEDAHLSPHWLARRSSLPSHNRRLSGPTIYSNGQPNQRASILMPTPVPTENTPLLNPPVPRIDEPYDREIVDDDASKARMFWEELRVLTRYALPVFGTHLLEFSLIMASTISIGHISTTALAAITLGSMTANVTGFSIVQGFASALDTLLPAAWTSPHPELVGLWAQRMVVVMSAMLVPILFIWFNAEPILLALGQDPEVARLAALYLRWVSLGLPGYTFSLVSRRYFQSQGLFAVPTQIIFVVAPLNVLLNYLLVWGPEKIRLGFIGAPIATAISFNLVSIMSMVYGVMYVPRKAWHPLSKRMFTSLGVLVHLGLAGVGQTASEWWAWELVALAASWLGPVVLATQSVLLVSASTTFQAPFALGVATSVRIGNLLGEGNAVRAGVASSTSLLMALALSAASSTMFLAFRNSWGYLFNNDPEVVMLVASVLPLVALFQVFDCNAGVTSGILRARGKQVTGALLNLSAYYVIGVPLGVWLAFQGHMGIYGLWIGLTVSLVYCAFFGTWLCLRTDWDREVWKAAQRLQGKDKHQSDDEERHLHH